ncbi:MAG: hypothetical protein WDN04_21655 [Rhodospirillales bacterium]
MQRQQETRGVGGIADRVERLLDAGERLRMIKQVDLQAADIERPYALGLETGGPRDTASAFVA